MKRLWNRYGIKKCTENGKYGTRTASGRNGKRRSCAGRTILIIAVALIIAGILNGGAQDVLAKGATICAECIGLG